MHVNAHACMQLSTNALIVAVQCITAHSSSGHDVDYYLLQEGTSSFPVTDIRHVHNHPPFQRDDVRIFKHGLTMALIDEVIE